MDNRGGHVCFPKCRSFASLTPRNCTRGPKHATLRMTHRKLCGDAALGCRLSRDALEAIEDKLKATAVGAPIEHSRKYGNAVGVIVIALGRLESDTNDRA